MSKASELTNQIINHFYKNGGFAFRCSSLGVYDQKRQMYRMAAKKGISDVLGVVKGRFVACEIKIGADRLSEEQTGFLKNIEHHGGLSVVIKNFAEFQEWWDKNIS